jgi:hypothetical protein
MELRTYGDAGSALPIFSDPVCLEWAAADMGKAKGSYTVGAIAPRNLVAMAADGKVGIAVCAYRDRKMPVYAILNASIVADIANALADAGRQS